MTTTRSRKLEFEHNRSDPMGWRAAAAQMVPEELPDRVKRAQQNIRIHFSRAIGRILMLLTVDALAFFAMRGVTRVIATVTTEPVARWRSVTEIAAVDTTQIWVALLVGLVVLGTYGPGDRRRNAYRLLLGCALGLALPLWNGFWRSPALVAQEYFAVVLFTWFMVWIGRMLLDRFIQRVIPHPRATRRTVLVGEGQDCAHLLSQPSLLPPRQFRVVAAIDIGRTEAAHDHFDALFWEHKADTVLICGVPSDAVLRQVIRAAARAECQILWVSPTFEDMGALPSVAIRQGKPFIELRAPILRARQLMVKRTLDVIVASLLLLLLSPLLALVAVLVMLDSPGPVLFRQLRPGLAGKPFGVLKFRTMRRDADQVLEAHPELYQKFLDNGCKLATNEDPRISRIGRLLRSTSLDELPQLFNVLRGEMSLVGPRPVVGPELAEYGELASILLSVRPGITGRWQVSGRSSLPLRERVRIDMDYISTWSVQHDLAIMLRTIPAVMKRRGAY